MLHSIVPVYGSASSFFSSARTCGSGRPMMTTGDSWSGNEACLIRKRWTALSNCPITSARMKISNGFTTRFPPPALLRRAASDFETFRSSAILACHNASVNEVNAILLGQLPGSAREYASVNIVDTDGMDQMQIPADEVLQAVDLSSLPPGKL